MEDIPKLPQPENVVDLVMLTGLIDIRSTSANIKDTIKKVDNVCRAYSGHFPNAKIHIGCVAPSNKKHVMFNNQLRQLAVQREVPFISADAMMDRNSGRLRPNMIHNVNRGGFHYTTPGVKTLAKEIKRSLRFRTTPTMPSKEVTQHANANYNASNGSVAQSGPVSRDPEQEIQNLLNMVMARLGNL